MIEAAFCLLALF